MDQDKKQKAIEVAIEQIKKQTKDPEAVVRLTEKVVKNIVRVQYQQVQSL